MNEINAQNPATLLRYSLDATYSPNFLAGETIVAVFHSSAARQLKKTRYWVVSSLLLAGFCVCYWLCPWEGPAPIDLGPAGCALPFMSGLILLCVWVLSLVGHLNRLWLWFELRSEEALFTTHHLFVARNAIVVVVPIEAIARLKAWISASDPHFYEGMRFSFHEHLVTMPFGFKHHYQMLNVPRDFPALKVLRDKGVAFEEVAASTKDDRFSP
jgi:hypothetical protein